MIPLDDGDNDRRCAALSKRTGERCKKAPMDGQRVCLAHGGATKRSKAAAARRVQAAAAAAAVQAYGLPRTIDPLSALLEEVERTAGHVQWIGMVIASMEPDALVWGTAEESEKKATEFPGTDTVRRAVPAVWLDLYQRERAHLVNVCRAAIAGGVEERLVRLAEEGGARLAGLFSELLNRIGATGEQREIARTAVPELLRGTGEPGTGAGHGG